MTGKQHLRMGIAAGVGIVVYTTLSKGDPTLSLCMVSTPIGSLLPDIDHDKSKLGSMRKNVTNITKLIIFVLLLLLVGLSIYSNGISAGILNGIVLLSSYIVIHIIENNKYVKDTLKFITKHRGIMHTLIPPSLLYFTTLYIDSLFYRYIVVGLSLGCVIHLIGDMATIEGTPLLWPLTKKNIRYFKFNSGKHMAIINIICNIWCVLFILLGIYLGGK